MASSNRVLIFLSSAALLLATISASENAVAAESKEFVLTLDHSNFSDTVSGHDFVVVEFYAPWCGHCRKLAPEYEKAASALHSHDPSIVLAKVDASAESNKELASLYDINGFPTLKILRKGGKFVQEYKGPRDAEGIAAYIKKQGGPASVEIKSAEEATDFIGENKVVIIGVFPEFLGEEYENFTALAEKLRSDYEFAYTSDARHLPLGETSVTGPVIWLFKPFDELSVDFQDFQVDTLEKFIQESSVPTVTIFSKDPSTHDSVIKFFETKNAKAMFFVNFSSEFDGHRKQYSEVAKEYKGKGIGFLLADIEASEGAFQYFGVKHERLPVIIIQTDDQKKYMKSNVEPEQIAPWIKDFQGGKVSPHKKSEPIPETNDEPVKVVVADTLDEMVFNSGKNVLLEFYAPWCGHCKQLAPVLDEVAISFAEDPNVVIAKLDATANDIPDDTFDVQGYPTIYFISATGTLSQYEGDRSKASIIEFILKNKDQARQTETTEQTLYKDEL